MYYSLKAYVKWGIGKLVDKIVDYDNYLKMKEHITFEEMSRIHADILKNADTTTEDFSEIWKDVIHSATKYTSTRAEWKYLTKEQKMNRDSARTIEHNTLINNFIVLERVFKLNAWRSAPWTEQLFLQEDKQNRTRQDVCEHRKRIGDFGNYLTCIYAVNGR